MGLMSLMSTFSVCITLLGLISTANCTALLCPRLTVNNADYADCGGEYEATQDVRVDWAPERVVYKHTEKDRYIFWNAGGLGWSIGKLEYLQDGRHWHKSGSDAKEPWQDVWLSGVTVKCSSNRQQKSKSAGCCSKIQVMSTGEALRDQPLYIGIYTRQAELYNGEAVYVKTGGGETLYTYFFISETHGVSLWVIGPSLGEFRAGIRNSLSGECVHDLDQGWKFASRSGVWADSDPSLSVKCHDFVSDTNGNALFESKKLRPRPKSFEAERPRSRGQDCQWSAWGGWSECSKSCDLGRQVRLRYHSQEASVGGAQCRGGNRERRVCNQKPCSAFRERTTTTTRSTTTTRRTTTTTRRTTTTTRRTTRRTTTTTSPRRTFEAVTKGFSDGRVTQSRSDGRVTCHVCGSLFDTEAPPCPQFDRSDPSQTKTCDIGEACLYYKWKKAENDFSVIRECFSTSILLGSLDNPVTPSSQCSPEPVESEAISACLCTSDLCNDLDQGELKGGRNHALVTTKSAAPVTQQPRHERTFSPLQDNSFNQITTASTASSVFPGPSRSSRGIRCFTCGTLFSRDGNSQCQEFDEADPSQQGLCSQDEVCLTYTWQKSRSKTGIVRECIKRSIVLGNVNRPLGVKAKCDIEDISDSSSSRVTACLCDTDLCNGRTSEDGGERLPQPARRIAPTTTSTSVTPRETPRRGSVSTRDKDRSLQTLDSGRPGLQCYSCGSLLNPDKTCDKFDATNATQSQTCLSGEACLMYSWSKSSTETATLRECFPTRVLLGSIRDPLTPENFCAVRDITDDGSGSIKACLCSTDYCNNVEDVGSPFILENEIFDLDDIVKTSTLRPQTRFQTSTTIRTTTTTRRPVVTTQRTTTVAPRSCPRGFEQVKSDCFYLSDRSVGWIEAKKGCEGRGARLVSLETEVKMQNLLDWVSDKTRRRRSKYWVGGNDIEVEGAWEWEGTRGKEVDSFGWTQLGLEESYEENCLAWSVSFGWNIGDNESSWAGASCCNRLRFICQA